MTHHEVVSAHGAWLRDWFALRPELHAIGLHATRSTGDHALIVVKDADGNYWHRWRNVLNVMSVKFALLNFTQQRDVLWAQGNPTDADARVLVTRESLKGHGP